MTTDWSERGLLDHSKGTRWLWRKTQIPEKKGSKAGENMSVLTHWLVHSVSEINKTEARNAHRHLLTEARH